MFNDDQFWLFFNFLYLNSSRYIFVWCWFFLSFPTLQEAGAPVVFYRSFLDSCNLDSSLLSILHVWFLFCFFTFLTFDRCEVYVKGMTCWVHHCYVLRNLQRSFFFLAAEVTSSYWFAVFLSVFFCLAALNQFHILSWMCLKGLILILYLFSVHEQINLWTISQLVWERQHTHTKKNKTYVGIFVLELMLW